MSSSSISTSAVKAILERLQTQQYRSSTKANYYGIWKNFNQFFVKLDIKPVTWEDRLSLYIAYLIHYQRKSATIKSYILAIRAVLRQVKVDLNEDKVLLASLTRACRIHNDRVTNHLPIKKSLLHLIVKSLLHMFAEQPYLQILYQALFLTAYYGLF